MRIRTQIIILTPPKQWLAWLGALLSAVHLIDLFFSTEK